MSNDEKFKDGRSWLDSMPVPKGATVDWNNIAAQVSAPVNEKRDITLRFLGEIDAEIVEIIMSKIAPKSQILLNYKKDVGDIRELSSGGDASVINAIRQIGSAPAGRYGLKYKYTHREGLNFAQLPGVPELPLHPHVLEISKIEFEPFNDAKGQPLLSLNMDCALTYNDGAYEKVCYPRMIYDWLVGFNCRPIRGPNPNFGPHDVLTLVGDDVARYKTLTNGTIPYLKPKYTNRDPGLIPIVS